MLGVNKFYTPYHHQLDGILTFSKGWHRRRSGSCRKQPWAVRVSLELVGENLLTNGTHTRIQIIDCPIPVVEVLFGRVTFPQHHLRLATVFQMMIADWLQATHNHPAFDVVHQIFTATIIIIITVVHIRAETCHTLQHYAARPKANIVGFPLFLLEFGTLEQERIVKLRHLGGRFHRRSISRFLLCKTFKLVHSKSASSIQLGRSNHQWARC